MFSEFEQYTIKEIEEEKESVLEEMELDCERQPMSDHLGERETVRNMERQPAADACHGHDDDGLLALPMLRTPKDSCSKY